MATHEKIFPCENATLKLKITYPDDLLNCVDEPRDWYTEEELDKTEEGMSKYPDMLLIPNNGSYIKKVKVKKRIKEIKYEDGVTVMVANWTDEYEEDQGQHWWNFWVPTYKHMKPIECKRCCFYRIANGLRELAYKNKSHEANWTRVDLEYEYTIEGEVNYFFSDVTFYYAYYNGTMGKDYAEFMDYFMDGIGDEDEMRQKRRRIAYLRVTGGSGRTVDLSRVSLTQRITMKCADGEWNYSPIIEKQCKLVGENYEPFEKMGRILTDEETKCDGLHFSILLKRPLPRGEGEYDIKGMRFLLRYNESQLVSIQADYKNGENNAILITQTEGQNGKKETHIEEKKFDGLEVTWNNHPDNIGYGQNNQKSNVFIYDTSSLANLSFNANSPIMSGDEPSMFNIKYTLGCPFMFGALKENGELFDKLIYAEVPLTEWGTNLYPAVRYPQVKVVKFNCDREADRKNVCGNNDSPYFVKMMRKVRDVYGEEGDFHVRNVDNWQNTTLEHELEVLRNNKAKFKILYINCHGTKFSNTDRSGAVLSHTPNDGSRILTFDHLDNLLKNKRPDEYYFIYAISCYGGGLFENNVHNDVTQNNYATANCPDNWNNVFILYGDCANSPAWGSGAPGGAMGQLFDLDSQKTYAQFATEITNAVKTCRDAQSAVLSEFLQNNYTFMKEMLDMSKLQWTDETYQKSIQHTTNIMLQTSKFFFDSEIENYCKQYPAAFLYEMIFEKLSTRVEGDSKYINRLTIDDPVVDI